MTEEIAISNDPQHVQELIETAEQKIIDASIPGEIADDVAIALLEAVNNAIIHGNQRNYNKYVTVRITIADQKIELVVMDEGTGFDPSKLDDPSRPENIFRPSGRGLYFIRQLMDEVEINSNNSGSEIIMRKYWLRKHEA
ncbi:MAG: ATP-binding protein [Candidatus Marinimicrobia bacterium]|nr:ATP-binding protein [Candidatus Neomarinimicrobiota bacterium]MCF7880264.1 ATP-binding protein [Candidatus Neomarinimicrobiota bacterium]